MKSRHFETFFEREIEMRRKVSNFCCPNWIIKIRIESRLSLHVFPLVSIYSDFGQMNELMNELEAVLLNF